MSTDSNTADYKEKEFTPVLPDSFWTIMDEARLRARVQAAKEAAAPATPEERIRSWVQGQGQGLGLGSVGNESLPSTPMMGEGAGVAGGVEGTWFDWRKNMPGDEEDEEADDEDASESGSDLPDAGDSSFEREVQETPKPRSGAFAGAGF